MLIRRSVSEDLGGLVEAPQLISVGDYNLWLRVATAGWRTVTCPHILVHYTQGIGISSDAKRLMRASLYNIDDLEKRLRLPPEMADAKRQQIRAEFRRLALYGCENESSRALPRQLFREDPGVLIGVNLVAGTLFAPALRLKRKVDPDLRRRSIVTVEDPRESELAEHCIPIDEQPFWNQNTRSVNAQSVLGDAVPVPRTSVPRTSVAPTSVTPTSVTGASPVPLPVTTIDAEEDFDWSGPLVRTPSRVTSMRSRHKAHRAFERYGVVPTYLVDHPVASQDEGRGPLKELLQSGQCEIGAQLHPWVNPPFVEVISNRNSYPGNPPMVLEHDKLLALTNILEESFDVRPRVYRAGRYGYGPNTAKILRHPRRCAGAPRAAAARTAGASAR